MTNHSLEEERLREKSEMERKEVKIVDSDMNNQVSK